MKRYNVKILNLLKKKKRYMNFILDIEPQSKKALGEKQSVIQKIFIEEIKRRNYQKIKSKVAIEIKVLTSAQNPPQIEKFVKNFLDIMHKKEKLLDVNDYVYLPFCDDKDIRYIKAKYLFTPGKSSIHIKIKPFSSFVSDIRFVDKEIGLNKDSHKYMEDNNWEHYQDLLKNKDRYLNFLSEKAYESMLKLTVLDLQKKITENISINPEIIRLIYPGNQPQLEGLNNIYNTRASYLIKVPIRILLPEVPIKENTAKQYKVLIKDQLLSYLKDKKVFSELYSPVVVSVFYMPPKTNHIFFKDLDNIMIDYIMPVFNEVFMPPISLMNLHMKETVDEKYKKIFKFIPKSLYGSAVGYEILELPKKLSQDDSGYLSVGFKIDELEDSIMDYLDKEINNYINNNEYIEY